MEGLFSASREKSLPASLSVERDKKSHIGRVTPAFLSTNHCYYCIVEKGKLSINFRWCYFGYDGLSLPHEVVGFGLALKRGDLGQRWEAIVLGGVALNL